MINKLVSSTIPLFLLLHDVPSDSNGTGICFSLYAFLDAVRGQHWIPHQVPNLYIPSAMHPLINLPYYYLVVPLMTASVLSLL
jgi:hypothetical protein